MVTIAQLETAAEQVHSVFPGTPQYCWPLLSARAGCEVWVKHENHTPIGAFKVRGGIVAMARLRAGRPGASGIVTATRGNHGQSVAFAAARQGLTALVVVPHGNSVEKNAAMRAFGAELVVHGSDFQEAREHAFTLAEERGLVFVGPYEDDLVEGVASYAMEFFRHGPALDSVYVPIGMGSGITGVIAVRDLLGLRTEVVGVVAEGAPAYALSFTAGDVVSTNSAETIADGLACRVPDAGALAVIRRGAARIVAVSDAEIRAAMCHYFSDTHNVAEGAGAAPLAALLRERRAMAGKRVGLVLSGGNVDRSVFRRVLAGDEAAPTAA